MILIDTGPLVALFDPQDPKHQMCARTFEDLDDDFATTVPVLTETFYMLSPESLGSKNLRQLLFDKAFQVTFLDEKGLERAFELMEEYIDHPMDLADASLIVAAESLHTDRIFTLDRRDFHAYRVKRGYRSFPLQVIP